MTELKSLQNKMNAINWDVWKTLCNCDVMLHNHADKKAVTAYMQIAVSCYGKELISACVQNYGFNQLKKYIN